MPLNPSQQKAVTGTGIQLVLAGPGSGKTRVITEKILHLIETGVKPENILALTFSDKAALEMMERLEKQTSTSDLTVSTFHAFALSVLEDNVLDSGISFSSGIISRANQLVWGLKNIDSFGLEYIEVGNNATGVIESIIDGISRFRDELISPNELDTYLKGKEGSQLGAEEQDYLDKLRDLLKVYRAYEKYKRAENLLDYDDMIHEAVRLFDAKPQVLRRYRERFTHVLVDEFQDTNYAQFRLVTQLADEHLCVVGDDDQTIYRFRGAYLTNMQDFRKQYASCTEILLDENYRSTETILALALRLMKCAPNRNEKRLKTVNPAGSKVTVADCANETSEALYVTREIQKLVGTPFFSRTEGQIRPMTYSDIAIICRRRMEGRKFALMLKKNGIPAEFVGEVDFFSEPVVRDIRAYLRAVENPLAAGIPLNRIMKAGGVPETVIQRINAAAKKMAREREGDDCVFAAMQQAGPVVPESAHLIRDIVTTLEQLIAEKDRATLSGFCYEVMRDATGLYQRAVSGENGQSLIFLNTFSRIVSEYESITRESTLADLLGYLDLLSGVSVEVGEREDADAVRILTVHKSKGREYPVVFVVDMVKDKFPLSYRAKPFSVPNDLARGLKTGDEEKALFLQEERRLCYVAMTRAQERLTFTLAKRYGERKTDAQPSRFLFELDYIRNPLMVVVPVNLTEERGIETPDNPVDTLRRKVRDQAVTAIDQMHLATAIQRIVELEKIRLLESGKSPDTFNPKKFFSIPTDDAAIRAAFERKPVPLIGKDHHFSASALKVYKDCPLCYKFRHVLQVPSLPRTFFSMGSAVHTVIEHLSNQQLEGIAPTKERALALLESTWSSEAYTSKTHEEEDLAKAGTILDTYIAWQAKNPDTILASEKKFQFPVSGRQLKGSIDRVEQTPEGGFVVVDFKTGTKPSSMTKNSIKEDIQMNTYCLAIRELYGRLPVRASLYYVRDDKMVDYYPTEESIAAFEKTVEEIIAAVCAERFDPAASFQGCRFCDYADLCEAKEAGE